MLTEDSNERESYKARFEWTRLPALDGALKWNYGRLYRLARMVGHVLRFPRRSDARTEGNSVASSTDGGSTGGIPSKSTGATARSINTTALKGKDHDSVSCPYFSLYHRKVLTYFK